MCKMMEDMRNEAELKKVKLITGNLLEHVTMSHEDIAKVTGLSLDEVKALDDRKRA